MSRGSPAATEFELLRQLRRGPTSAAELAGELRVSQPTISRLTRRAGPRVLTIGRARATRYVADREILDCGPALPLFAVDESGAPARVADLHGAAPSGFVVQPSSDRGPLAQAYHEDLPYFLDDLRPSGFLGRLVPKRHPELGYPADVRLWSGDHSLSWASRHGWNLPGNFIVGDRALGLYAAHAAAPPDLVQDEEREARYGRLASDALAGELPGSSAAGEQPKFLVTRERDRQPVLVKFSPPVRDASTARIADLLVAEHLVLDRLRAHGHDGAKSSLFRADGRVFLEVERFDRLPGNGRRGVISLHALDTEFVGSLRDWPTTAAQLLAQGRIDDATFAEVRWRHTFGKLIANDDMHAGNLAFFFEGGRPGRLTPVYDMAPALYAPHHGHVRDEPFALPAPGGVEAGLWVDACEVARGTWKAIAACADVSDAFRSIASANAEVVARGVELARFLPAG